MAENSLKEKTAKGLMWGSIGNGAQLILGTLFGIFLARLLSPSDYGMVGVLQVFILIANTIQDSGFRMALANRKGSAPRRLQRRILVQCRFGSHPLRFVVFSGSFHYGVLSKIRFCNRP